MLSKKETKKIVKNIRAEIDRLRSLKLKPCSVCLSNEEIDSILHYDSTKRTIRNKSYGISLLGLKVIRYYCNGHIYINIKLR